MKIKYNGEIVEAETVEMNYVRITGTDTFLSPDQFTIVDDEELAEELIGKFSVYTVSVLSIFEVFALVALVTGIAELSYHLFLFTWATITALKTIVAFSSDQFTSNQKMLYFVSAIGMCICLSILFVLGQ